MKFWKWFKRVIGWLCAIFNNHKSDDISDTVKEIEDIIKKK